MVRITGRRRPDRGIIGRSGAHRDYRMSTYERRTGIGSGPAALRRAVGPSSFNFLKPSNGNISWRTDEYSAEIMTSVIGALRDALLESRGNAPFDGVVSAAASSDDQSGWRRYEFRRRLNMALATLSWPMHILSKVSKRQACLLVEIEKDA
jgi:hypothetical protein